VPVKGLVGMSNMQLAFPASACLVIQYPNECACMRLLPAHNIQLKRAPSMCWSSMAMQVSIDSVESMGRGASDPSMDNAGAQRGKHTPYMSVVHGQRAK